MKRKRSYMVGSILIICILSGCVSYNAKKLEYYSQKENYILSTGTLESIQYSDEFAALYFEFSEITPSYDDICFKIVGQNVQIVKQNGLDTKLRPGDKVTFVSAPRYFGDGYVFPIVALSAKESNFLDYEEGLSNFLDWLRVQ